MNAFEQAYVMVRLLHQGRDKSIWQVRGRWSGDECVVKMQSKDHVGLSVLHEGKFIQSTQGYKGIPFLHWVGRDERSGRLLLIVDRLGDRLSDLHLELGVFTVKTVCLVGMQLVDILRMYHGKKYVHGHLTPTLVQTGRGKLAHELYLNDLIDSHSFIRKDTLKHVDEIRNKKNDKVNMFMGAHRLETYSFSRRDDIYAVLLIMVYGMKGTLPWGAYFDRKTSFRLKETDNVEKIKKAMSVEVEVICQGLPLEMSQMLTCARKMQFSEEPNYNYYSMMMEKILLKNGYQRDNLYDWTRNRKMMEKRLKIKKQFYQGDKNICKLDFQQMVLENCYLPYADSISLD